MQNEERKQIAINILSELGLHDLEFLGFGSEGIVFHDREFVYKVIVPKHAIKDKMELFRRLSFFRNPISCKHITRLEDVIEFEDYIIEKYKYEVSSPITTFVESEVIDFLTECWQNKMVIKDCKIKNFIRTKDGLKLIDLDGRGYDDNLFLNMCVRMYLYINFASDESNKESICKLQRSAINNFNLPELSGARDFVNRVFANIIFKESKSYISHLHIATKENAVIYTDINTLPNLEHLFYAKIKDNLYLSNVEIDNLKLNDRLYFEPQRIQVSYRVLQPLKDKVTLLIKTCVQDVMTIEKNIKHIVKQLSSPNPFYEVIVSVDTKEKDFLREYYSGGSLQELLPILKKLVNEKIIDRYFIFDSTQTESVNQRWFGLASVHSHTTKNCPVSSQLYAFEQCRGDYILQTDSDVLIGRIDYEHSFLTDMIAELKKSDKVLSVGFNICNKTSKEYFGFENGGFVPEVRLGLFDKTRLFHLRPFPNSLDDLGRLQLSWHRSLEVFQRETGYCSIRGGDNRTFYVHPQNYRKKESYAWMSILDRVEQCKIPDCQYGGFDCEGSLYDWCTPKRNEKMVIVSVFRNVTIDRFLRFWCSIMSQSFQEFGVVLYDDCSDNGLPYFIDNLIESCRNKVTFIKGRHKETRMANVYRCIHYFCANPQSIIVMVDGDDALIGKDVLSDIWNKYEMWSIDVSVGRIHQTYRMQPHYRYPVNFCNPRSSSGGNVWQHLKTFRKYLFDSIPLSYFKYESTDKVKLNKSWFEKCDDYAMMIPIVEMSKYPLQMDNINYFYERDYEKRNADRDIKEKCIASILNKPSLSPESVVIGRKIFMPDFERIEIDITYDCNLKCFGCNRSCAQKPSSEHIEVTDIENFVFESVKYGKQWKQINVLGGEPTLHEDFLKILEILQHYADRFSPSTIIKVVSNGISEKSRELCELARTSYKNVLIDYGSYKTTNKVDYFSPFNDAPIDDSNYTDEDFSKACWVTSYCGIGLTPRGYYGCAVCGGIDRVLDERNGVGSFVDLSEEKLKEHFNKFCRLCGNYKAYSQNQGNCMPRCEKEPFRNVISKTWKEIYKKD
ncbi:MAG: 4Fe-4S cluster-binding domain-containing protein [Bacteroidales bacterium]|nr:4Fe-4S cluster-binding domain-containing protein [Bacteroidales bacterium]